MNCGKREQVILTLQVKTPPDILKNEACRDILNIQVQKESRTGIQNLSLWIPKMARGQEPDPDQDQEAMVMTSKKLHFDDQNLEKNTYFFLDTPIVGMVRPKEGKQNHQQV